MPALGSQVAGSDRMESSSSCAPDVLLQLFTLVSDSNAPHSFAPHVSLLQDFLMYFEYFGDAVVGFIRT